LVFNAQALVKARKDANLTQEQLAEKAQVAANTVWYLESGRRPNPDTSTVQKIAAALNKPFTVFFGLDPHKTEKCKQSNPNPAA